MTDILGFIFKLCGILLLTMIILGFCDWLRIKLFYK